MATAKSKRSDLPELYRTNWIPAEDNPKLYVEVFVSPDVQNPVTPTTEQLRFMRAMLSGHYDEGWFAGGNSCQPVDITKVLMADGTFRLLKDVKVGDMVFCPDETGKAVPGKVVAWHDRGDREVFKLSFSDGGYVYATKEHNFPSWRICKGKYIYKKRQVAEFRTNVAPSHRDKLQRAFIEFPEVILPMEPYFMGILLGDGGITKDITVTTIDFEILDELKRQCEKLDLRLVTTSDHITYRLSSQKKGHSNRGSFQKNPITKVLEDLGLFGHKSVDKFIPNMYKKTSVKQRMELLAGLIDTDGSYASGAGLQYELASSSKTLAEDVVWLCKSLGMHAKYSDRIVNGFFNARVYISSNEAIPCRIKRKQLKKKSFRPRDKMRRILRSVESMGVYKTCEITVDHPNHCYISDDWVSTGNSGKTWTAKFMANHWGMYKIKPGKGKFRNYDEFLDTPYNILCTGPEGKQAIELWQHIETSFKQSPFLKFQVKGVTTGTRRNIHPVISLNNGTNIEAVGLQDKGKHVEGQAYDLILINEPADAKYLIEIYERVLIPRTWRRGGVICGFGTPKGKGEYYNLWRRGQETLDGGKNKYYESRVYSQYSDSRTNPYADQEAIAKATEGKSEDWVKERVEGKFTDSVFAAFKDTEIDFCIDPSLKREIAPSTNHQYIHGVDFGRKGDFTGCITWDVTVRPHLQVNVYRAGGGAVSWENIFEDLIKIYNRYGGEFVVDATGMGGDMQQEWLNDLGIPFIPYQFGGSPARKVRLINNLQDYISKRKFRMAPNDHLIDELRQYPADLDDKDIATDMVMALCLVAWGARNYEPLGPVEFYSR